MICNTAVIITGIGAGLVLISGFIEFGVPMIVESQIIEYFQLQEGSDNFERWKDIHIPVACKLYFFNVTNADAVQNGAKPIVEEIGPYVYNQHRKKIDVTRTDDVLSYYQYQYFEFDKEASAPLTQNDKITIVNLPLMAVVQIAEEYTGDSFIQLRMFDSLIPTLFNNPNSVFLTTTPQDFLFDGVDLMCNSTGLFDSIICNIIESFAPQMMPRLEDGRFRFSFYGYKNATRGDYYSVNSGTKDISKLGEIVAWGNSSTLNTWPKDQGTCNKVSGTDGGIFPPFRTTSSILSIFNTDICRSVTISYYENITIAGIDAYRYMVDETMFTSPSNFSENECFCLKRTKGITGDDGCLLDGAMELWGCQGEPVVVSLPHFYLANEVYQNGVIGLKPNKSLHSMFVDLVPMTASVLYAAKRGQVNVFIKPITGISVTANLATTLMPVLWIDETFSLDDENIDLLKRKLFDLLDIFSTAKWCFLISGSIIFTFGFVWLLKSVWRPPRFMKLPLNETQ